MAGFRSDRLLTPSDYAPREAGIFTCDLQRNLFFADAAVAELFGIDYDPAKNGAAIETYLNRIHDDDRPRVARSIFEAIAGDRPQMEEYRVAGSDGCFRDVVGYGRSFNDHSGNPVLFSGIIVPASQLDPRSRLS